MKTILIISTNYFHGFLKVPLYRNTFQPFYLIPPFNPFLVSKIVSETRTQERANPIYSEGKQYCESSASPHSIPFCILILLNALQAQGYRVTKTKRVHSPLKPRTAQLILAGPQFNFQQQILSLENNTQVINLFITGYEQQ